MKEGNLKPLQMVTSALYVIIPLRVSTDVLLCSTVQYKASQQSGCGTGSEYLDAFLRVDTQDLTLSMKKSHTIHITLRHAFVNS